MMNFFKEISAMAPGVAITMNIMEKNGSMSVSILPNALKGVQAMVISGTPEELDASFLDQIRQPMEATTAVVSNSAEYQESLVKAAPSKPTVKDKKVNAPVPDAEEAEEDEEQNEEPKPVKAAKPVKEKVVKEKPVPAPDKKGPVQLEIV